MPERILIAGYDPRWPDLFAGEADRIQSALGSRVLRLEHVGSTSVPGLAAKPVIDIVLAVKDSADEAGYVAGLDAAGYTFHRREPHWHEHRMLKRPGTGLNLHVFSDGCLEIERMLLFRNWLRENAADRILYQRTKLALATQEWPTVQHYADAKTSVVEEILLRAAVHSTKPHPES
ncbi:MAG: GrpB family protein [Acidobacteriota bacterium]